MASDASHRYPFEPPAPRRVPAQSTNPIGGTVTVADLEEDLPQPLEEELPQPNARRWYRRDKRRVVTAVRNGDLAFREACQRYRLSYQEFVDWERISGADDRSGGHQEDHERRRYHRIAMRSPASLRVDGRRVECEIENLSATGALLLVGEGRGYPSHVSLEVPHSRSALPARVAWRSRYALGIEFTAAPGMVASQFDNRWIEGSNALRCEAQ